MTNIPDHDKPPTSGPDGRLAGIYYILERADNNLLDIINDIRLMMDTESGFHYDRVPPWYKEAFETWCDEKKQQSWEGNWDRAWINYRGEFLEYILYMILQTNNYPNLGPAPYEPPYVDQ